MKETKVYVDELPESCFDCHCAYYGGCVIDTGNVEDFDNFDWSERRAKHCPLIDIKTHDREVVKEVCEKIKYKLGSIEDILINLGNGKEDALNYFTHILNEIEKEFEK